MKNNARTIFQTTTLGLILYVAARPLFDKHYAADFERYCPFGGLSSFFSKMNLDAMACSMNATQVVLGFALLLGVGFIGKLFCSHICPIGTVTEWIGAFGRKFNLQREMPANADRVLRSLKYILLFITVYFTMTDSELFCKKYDPYFAAVNGFNNSDIVLAYAAAAMLLTLGGALFYRLFWCKYLCPMGAFSNIFLNAAPAGSLIVLYAAAYVFGFPLHPVWLLGGLVLIGLVTEVGFMRSFLLPIPRITRNEQTCSNCHFCDDHCPQGIKISATPEVRHIDCNLCTDCAYTCPLKQTLTVNNTPQHKYLAPAAALVLIASALITAQFVEFTTISLRWGGAPASTATFTQAGMKSITCYGSSMALAGTLEEIDGIVGVDTYASSHTVTIFYDSSVISGRDVKASLFTSTKRVLRSPSLPNSEPVGVLDIGVLGFFDAVDFRDLASLLGEMEGVLGFETRFGEPVHTTIYYLPSRHSPPDIRALLNRGHVLRDGERVELEFETPDEGEVRSPIRFAEYRTRIFNGYDDAFNGYEEYEEANVSAYRFPMAEAANPALRKELDLLASHLSKDEGVVRFATYYDGAPMGCVYFDPAKTTGKAVMTALAAKELTYYISDTETESVPNPFHIGAPAAPAKK